MNDVIKNMQLVIQQVSDSLRWLRRSYDKCAVIGIKSSYSDNDYDNFEVLTSRYARTLDILVNKLYRAIDYAELEEQGTIIDVMNRAERRGLIESVDEIRRMKDLRNNIAHEYSTENLDSLFEDTLKSSEKFCLSTSRKPWITVEIYPATKFV